MSDTLAERIKWILDNCRTVEGKPWTAKDLSLAAGLTQSHVGQIKRGTVAGGNSDTIKAIARAAAVSAGWLLTGEGQPIEPSEDERPLALASTEQGTEWRRIPGFEEAANEVRRRAPIAPARLLEEIGMRNGRRAPNPMTADWLLVEVHQALKAMSVPERAALLLAEMDKAVAEQREKDGAQVTPAQTNEPPALPGITVAPPRTPDEEPKKEPKPKASKKPAAKKPAPELPGMGKKR